MTGHSSGTGKGQYDIMKNQTTIYRVGDKITTRAGMTATIIRIHAAGAIDIQVDETGDCFRVSGLAITVQS